MTLAAPALGAVRVSVHVEGINGKLKTNVMASLSIVQYKNLGTNPEATIRRLDAQAPAEIRRALQPFGYFSPQIDSQLTHNGEVWNATYRIAPGKPVMLRHVTVRILGPGADDPVFKSIAQKPPMQPGRVLDQDAYSLTKQMLLEAAAERGYLDAHFTQHTLTVNPQELWADALLTFRTGTRYRFGKVSINQDILDPAFVRRYVRIHPGEPYNAQALADLQSELSASDYFASVVIVPEKRKAKNHAVPIRVDTTPAKRNVYTVGVGYGTDTGPRLSFGWENRRVNSKGHMFRVDARVSHVQTQVVARYIIPQANPATDRLVYSATLNEQDYGGTVGHLAGLGIGRITMVDGWQQTVSLDANRYTSDIGSESLGSHLLMPGIRFSRIVASPPNFPQHGYSVTADFSGAAKTLASSASFLRADVAARYIFPFGGGRLLLHGELGAIATSDFSEIPVALRFYAGGDDSVRGYAYQSLGPQNAAGLVVGGRYLKIASVEYDHPVAGPWGVAGFFDAGSASNSFASGFDKGVGIGARYRTPIGAVRLDIGHPLGHPELGFYRIHLSVGLAL